MTGNLETKEQVSLRHRAEWLRFREEILEPVQARGDEGSAKFAKAVADILKIYQEGERKAYGFGDREAGAGGLAVTWEDQGPCPE